MVGEKMNLLWNDFETNAPNTIKELWNDQNFTDVTLATVDGHQINVHKVILSSCSQFFRNILLRNPHPNPLLYLKDIRFKELEMIIKFIYQGQCDVGDEELKDFLDTGKALEISGLMENMEMGEEEEVESVPMKEQHTSRRYPKNNIETLDINDVTW